VSRSIQNIFHEKLFMQLTVQDLPSGMQLSLARSLKRLPYVRFVSVSGIDTKYKQDVSTFAKTSLSIPSSCVSSRSRRSANTYNNCRLEMTGKSRSAALPLQSILSGQVGPHR
jgi:hypothetical protein